MQEIGIEETREHVHGLERALIAGVDELGGTVVTPRQARSSRRPDLRQVNGRERARRRARARGIVTSERDGNLRISAHAYNSLEDIDLVLEALARHKRLLA